MHFYVKYSVSEMELPDHMRVGTFLIGSSESSVEKKDIIRWKKDIIRWFNFGKHSCPHITIVLLAQAPEEEKLEVLTELACSGYQMLLFFL